MHVEHSAVPTEPTLTKVSKEFQSTLVFVWNSFCRGLRLVAIVGVTKLVELGLGHLGETLPKLLFGAIYWLELLIVGCYFIVGVAIDVTSEIANGNEEMKLLAKRLGFGRKHK